MLFLSPSWHTHIHTHAQCREEEDGIIVKIENPFPLGFTHRNDANSLADLATREALNNME